METKWRHGVTWKSGCFSAPERGDLSKDSKRSCLSDYHNPIVCDHSVYYSFGRRSCSIYDRLNMESKLLTDFYPLFPAVLIRAI